MAKPARKTERSSKHPEGDEYNPDRPDLDGNSLIPSESKLYLERLGVDLQRPEEVSRFVSTVQMSVSRSPYPSPEMLFSYDPYKPGFSDHIISSIDGQREHRQRLESLRTERSETRLDRAQRNAFILGAMSVVAGAGAGYAGVDWKICVALVAVGIGGPNVATVVSRMIKPKA